MTIVITQFGSPFQNIFFLNLDIAKKKVVKNPKIIFLIYSRHFQYLFERI
jgi:hypothetical protein